MADKYDTFFVGANVLAIRDNKLLLGKRKDIEGDGKWALPGGHLEHNENILSAAARELEEETGLISQAYTFVGVVNNPERGNSKHYIQFGFRADGVQGEAELREPERCHEWQWFDLDNLPEVVFTKENHLILADCWTTKIPLIR